MASHPFLIKPEPVHFDFASASLPYYQLSLIYNKRAYSFPIYKNFGLAHVKGIQEAEQGYKIVIITPYPHVI